MTKYITVRLTQDQLTELIRATGYGLDAMEWWVREYPSRREYADRNPDKPDLRAYTDRTWTPQKFETTKQAIAFRKRLRTTLAQAKNLEQ